MNIIAYAHSLKLAKIYTISIRECVDQDERVFEQFLLRHEILREIIYAAQASLDRATFSNFRHRPGQAVSSAAVAPSQTSIFIYICSRFCVNFFDPTKSSGITQQQSVFLCSFDFSSNMRAHTYSGNLF